MAAACAGGSQPTSEPIVARIPWSGYEEASYVLVDDDGQEVARGVFTIQQEDDRYRLSQRFQSTTATDETVALVGADDLAPIEVERVINGRPGELRFQVNYVGGIAEVIRTTADERRSDQLNVPPNAYDMASSLFLWRTIPFAPGYEVTYTNMMTAVQERSRRASVTLRVAGKERVRVPAGTFEAWRVEVRSGGRDIAWYAVDDGHPLVMYDNGEQTFLLEALTQR